MLRRINSVRWIKGVVMFSVIYAVLAQVFHLINTVRDMNNVMPTNIKFEFTSQQTRWLILFRTATASELIVNKKVSAQDLRLESEMIQTMRLKIQSLNTSTNRSVEVIFTGSKTPIIAASNLSSSKLKTQDVNELDVKVRIFVRQSKEHGVTLKELVYFTRLIEAFDKSAIENNVSYFLSSGTLLGLFRHGGLIPWDDDLDVLMAVNHFDKICRAMNGTDGWRLIKVNNYCKLFSSTNFITSNNSLPWNWPYLDIFLYDEDSYSRRLDLIGKKHLYLSQSSVFPLRRMNFLNTKVSVPYNIEQAWLQISLSKV